MGYVVLTIRIHREDDAYVGLCEELDVSSFGDSVDEALAATLEATALYLETLDDEGERDAVFAERGITMLRTEPADTVELSLITHPGEVVSTQRLVLADA